MSHHHILFLTLKGSGLYCPEEKKKHLCCTNQDMGETLESLQTTWLFPLQFATSLWNAVRKIAAL